MGTWGLGYGLASWYPGVYPCPSLFRHTSAPSRTLPYLPQPRPTSLWQILSRAPSSMIKKPSLSLKNARNTPSLAQQKKLYSPFTLKASASPSHLPRRRRSGMSTAAPLPSYHSLTSLLGPTKSAPPNSSRRTMEEAPRALGTSSSPALAVSPLTILLGYAPSLNCLAGSAPLQGQPSLMSATWSRETMAPRASRAKKALHAVATTREAPPEEGDIVRTPYNECLLY